jgi:glycosyltransferase involved in cell wall biosynthesis
LNLSAKIHINAAIYRKSILRISVVVCTYNRAQVVKNAVAGLLQQVRSSTEIIVVNGPSTDNTLDVLTAFGSKIKITNCPTANVSRARNIGIEASRGDVVAFIDDDAVPASNWLSELASVYHGTEAAGAGGPVFNEGAITEPWRICTCTRTGDVNVDSKPPISQYLRAGADPFMYLAGCNMSFRRSALIAAGGFNEGLEYGYDDVEICRVLVDYGRTLAWSPKVKVHHRPAASEIRDSKGIIRDISGFMRSQAIFALQDPHAEPAAVMSKLDQVARHWSEVAVAYARQGHFSEAERDRFIDRMTTALKDGRVRGLERRFKVAFFG